MEFSLKFYLAFSSVQFLQENNSQLITTFNADVFCKWKKSEMLLSQIKLNGQLQSRKETCITWMNEAWIEWML